MVPMFHAELRYSLPVGAVRYRGLARTPAGEATPDARQSGGAGKPASRTWSSNLKTESVEQARKGLACYVCAAFMASCP